MKRKITLEGGSNNSRKNIHLVFKNNAPFIACISKTNNALIDNAENLHVAMPMYNLIGYRKNYRKITNN